MLEINQKAIDFKLKDAYENEITLSQFKGKKVILYFYPKDNTPGCTKQACTFKSHYDEFKELDCVVIGISKDSTKSHLKFIEKYELPFILLSDPECEVIQAYDVWKEKTLYGKKFMGIVRSTYLIDEDSMIIWAKEKVSPEKNPLELLDYIKQEKA